MYGLTSVRIPPPIKHIAEVKSTHSALLSVYHDYSLHLVGHSMGAGIAAILALRLRTDPTDPTVDLDLDPPLDLTGRLSVTGIASPCVMTSDAANSMRDIMVSLSLSHDVVPRINVVSTFDN